MQPHLIITGFSDGLGQALKNQFKDKGYQVTGIARSQGDFHADFTDLNQTRSAIDTAIANKGHPKVVIHNAADFVRGPFLEVESEDFERAWRHNVLTAINVSKSVLTYMEDQGFGTLILTGATASTRGSALFSPFSSAKFALRGLAQSLAREFQSKGIHVVHPILDGIIFSDLSRQRFPNLRAERCLDPNALAKIYYNLVQQDPSAWTHEIDIRPQLENF